MLPPSRRALGHPYRVLHLLTAAVLLSACTGPAGGPVVWVAPDTTASAPTAPAAAPGAAAAPNPTATPGPTVTSRPSSTRPVKKNKPPVVRSVRAEPGRVDPLACDPPSPPERPLVIADVRDPDNSPRELVVKLDFGTGGGSYQGTVRMTYSADRRSFVYRLPPVTAAAVGRGSVSIGISVWADDGLPTGGVIRRPVTSVIRFTSQCGDG